MKIQTKILISALSIFCLTSCTAIVRKAQNFNDVPFDSYPSAPTADPNLSKVPASIDLSLYKSVHERLPYNKNITIALATSGGGYRAANVTLGVLIGLEKLQTSAHSNLLKSVDYYSSVSGSGLAVGYYLDQYYNAILNHDADNFSLANSVSHFKNEPNNPFVNDLSSYLFFGDNRHLALEMHLNHALFATKNGDFTLGDMFIPKDSSKPVLLPYWAANATIYQNVAIFPFTPDILAHYQIDGYYHDNKYNSLSDPYDFPASIGVTASASIPFITPPTTLSSKSCTKDCYLHLMDGGIADNLAIFTALNFLQQDNSQTKVLIVVDASKAVNEPFSLLKNDPNTITTLERLLGASCDVNRQHLRPNIKFVTDKLLTNKHTKKVIVVYLDLDAYPKAQNITTNLMLSTKQQELLIKTGEELVASNPTFKQLAFDLSH